MGIDSQSIGHFTSKFLSEPFFGWITLSKPDTEKPPVNETSSVRNH